MIKFLFKKLFKRAPELPFEEYAKFYKLPDDADLCDITGDLLKSSYVKDAQKQAIKTFGRRIFVFTYPSDGLKIKGLISFVPEPQRYPTLVFLRGGNRIFGIRNPGGDVMCPGKYTVLSTTYRDGVSEGVDEFGGNDVNDVKHLIDFIPELEKRLHLKLQSEKMYMVGNSRGGMQMFLALARFPELQSRFSKIIALSGMLDMHRCIATRPDVKEMLIQDFGLNKSNEEEWITQRDPLLAAEAIRRDLPILIIQGTKDDRVDLEQGYHMLRKLQAQGNQVSYLEFKGATHCLNNFEDKVKILLDWLEKEV